MMTMIHTILIVGWAPEGHRIKAVFMSNKPTNDIRRSAAVPNLVKRWEAVYSSDEEGEAGGAETQAVRIEKYFFFEIQEFYIFLRW